MHVQSFFIFVFFVFGGRHAREFPACEITDLAIIGFVANRLPVGVMDEPITPICVIFGARLFGRKQIFGFGTVQQCHKCEVYHSAFLYVAGGTLKHAMRNLKIVI